MASPSATQPPPPSLEVVGGHLSYGDFAALTGIDLSVEKGEFVALLGPSGCGKTSLLRAIAGFVPLQRGEIRLNGRDVAGLPPRRRNIGIVFQSYALFPHMSVLDNVRFGLDCRDIPKAVSGTRAHAALDLVGLADFADRRPRQLSGGQQQRVALARALVIEPDLLLLDEPLGALDRELRVRMQTELKTLQRRLGVTALFVTHDQEEAMSMADRIVVMRQGAIMQVAAPETLFRAPNCAWVCEFVGAGNLLRGPLEPAGPNVMRLRIGPGSFVDVPAASGAGEVVQVPFDRMRLARADEASGLEVIGRRYLGSVVELHMAGEHGTVRAHMPMEQAANFPIGCHASARAETADCRRVSDR